MSKKGFTLIELLVVIAIIGILASIVLVTFPTAQNKAKDTRIKAAIAQMRTEMVDYWDTNGSSYLGFDSTVTANMTTLDADVTANGGTVVYQASAAAACFYSGLNVNSGTDFFCADSTGVADITTDPNVLGACDGTTFVCP